MHDTHISPHARDVQRSLTNYIALIDIHAHCNKLLQCRYIIALRSLNETLEHILLEFLPHDGINFLLILWLILSDFETSMHYLAAC